MWPCWPWFDPGVTAATVVLAWELERRVLPTVTLCAGQTIHLAAAMSLPVLPGLPPRHLTIQRHASSADVAAETIWILGEVVEGLTTAPESLRQYFLDRFTPEDHRLCPDTTGALRLWSPRRAPLTDPDAPTIAYDPAEDTAAVYERFCDSGMCDGLPVIPPTAPRVEAMLTFADRPDDEVLIPHCFPSGLPLTVRILAINAVMAGCRPEYLPILLTAAQAMAEPAYRLTQATVTSHPAGNAILVSGPLAQD
ncbi:hypothetical protein NKDENANG_02124 [Candidatus Entotheonellaceae bacterium PAL068K]